MSTVIISCTSLADNLKCAQEKMGANYQVYFIDRKYHIDPTIMREKILNTIKELPKAVDTVLVSMGFCGGSWGNISVDKRIVIPRVDDCISLQLHTKETSGVNLKKGNCMYMTGSDSYATSHQNMKERLCERMGAEDGEATFNKWFAGFDKISIIETGTYEMHDKEFLALAEQNTNAINAEIEYVRGSNIILEKLVAWKWDEQFIVCDPNKKLDFNDECI